LPWIAKTVTAKMMIGIRTMKIKTVNKKIDSSVTTPYPLLDLFISKASEVAAPVPASLPAS
jgi:hypothetical protein